MRAAPAVRPAGHSVRDARASERSLRTSCLTLPACLLQISTFDNRLNYGRRPCEALPTDVVCLSTGLASSAKIESLNPASTRLSGLSSGVVYCLLQIFVNDFSDCEAVHAGCIHSRYTANFRQSLKPRDGWG